MCEVRLSIEKIVSMTPRHEILTAVRLRSWHICAFMHECRRIWDPVGPSAVQIRGPEAKTSRGRDGPSAHRTSVRAVFARRGGEGGEEEEDAIG